MPRAVSRHHPIITARIRFGVSSDQTPLQGSTITPWLNFTNLSIADSDLSTVKGTAERPAGTDHCPKETMSHCVIKSAVTHQPSDDEDADLSLKEDDNEAAQLDEDSGNEDEADPPEQNMLIPKPQGKPGHPKSSGYNLQKELRGWTEKDYTQVKASCMTFLHCTLLTVS